jgi:hypothetical protein
VDGGNGRLAGAACACGVDDGAGLTGQLGGVPLHSHDYNFNDVILPVGVRYYRNLAHEKNLK